MPAALPFLRIFFIASLAFAMGCGGRPPNEKPVVTAKKTTPQQAVADSCTAFNALMTAIRDGNIPKQQAQTRMKELLPGLAKLYYSKGGANADTQRWVFPLQGYDAKAIGGVNGNGYIASGYRFFDGNKHGGHPAYDIFTYDKKQQSIDDRTGRPVKVLSVSGGIVVSLEAQWEAGSTLRGGRYIWIYDPASSSLLYYAHNARLLVKLGEIVKPGQPIAEVGRTGYNASKKRSPTHLHFMQIALDKNCKPSPIACFQVLKVAKMVK